MIKLLFDQNLSPRLVNLLTDLYPDSNHLHNLGLDTAEDAVVWQYARENDFIVVTKDADFSELVSIKGFPPKVIWIRLGNCKTNDIENVIRSNHQNIRMFSLDDNLGILILS